jgi:hypothetical protein
VVPLVFGFGPIDHFTYNLIKLVPSLPLLDILNPFPAFSLNLAMRIAKKQTNKISWNFSNYFWGDKRFI